MKQAVNVLLPTELVYWLICEKERNQTTISQVVVKALRAYKEANEVEDE